MISAYFFPQLHLVKRLKLSKSGFFATSVVRPSTPKLLTECDRSFLMSKRAVPTNCTGEPRLCNSW